MNMIQILFAIPLFIVVMFCWYAIYTGSGDDYTPLHSHPAFELSWDIFTAVFMSALVSVAIVLMWKFILVVAAVIVLVYGTGFGIRKVCLILNI